MQRNNLLEALSDNIKIDQDKCTACGICVETCILDNLRMKLAPCRQACPLGVNCQGYVQLILRGEDPEGLAMVERELPFPGILGHLCSAPCEQGCYRGQTTGRPVAIRALKHYLVQANDPSPRALPEKAPDTGKRIAVVGSGPAGMLAAYDLLIKGHAVTVFDAENEPGGMLRRAVPEFRLPRAELDAEWRRLEDLGVTFQGGNALGRDIAVDDLSRRFDAVILALGCPLPKSLGIPGEEADGVITALDFLKTVRAGQSPPVGEKVLVVGGGEVALDAAQTALRLGAGQVTLAFLETADAMPCGAEALELARSEGVLLEPSWGPTRIQVENGRAVGMDFQRCLAVYDGQGNFAPSFDDCALYNTPADTIIVAIGQQTDPGAYGGKRPECHPVTLQTGEKNVFLAGDGLNGPTTIVQAMASGREAAISAHRLVTGEHLTYGRRYGGPVDTEFEISLERGSQEDRTPPKWRACQGKGDFEPVELALTQQEAQKEAGRCYSCGRPFGKYRTCWFCLPCEVECPQKALWVDIPYLLR